MIADLHTHTIYSDGLFTPEQIVDLAVKKSLNALAITDHDTTLGVNRAVERSKLYKKFFIIPGIELSCTYEEEEVHILGYFIDNDSYDIMELTRKMEKERLGRAKKIILKLNELGIHISLYDVKQMATGNIVGRPHIARALIKNGWVENMNEAFNKYLGKDKLAYIERYKLSLEKGINIIHNNGGIAVIAHPGLIKKEEAIYKCIELGIDGMEVIHSKHLKGQIVKLIDIANKYNLIKTGGSDFHGELI